MNLFLLSQSGSVRMFYRLQEELRRELPIEQVGLFVAYLRAFDQFRDERPDIEDGRVQLVKEWEIVQRARNRAPDRERLAALERRLGVPSLWPAIVADRRLSMGPDAALRQDYDSRYTHDQLLSILEETASALERAFDEVRPDAVISFLAVTAGEYLSYLICRARGIPFLNLRPTRIRNLVTYGESVYEPSAHVAATFRRFVEQGIPADLREKAARHLAAVRSSEARYEGVVPPSRKVAGSRLRLSKAGQQLARLAREEYAHYARGYGDDHYAQHWLSTRLANKVEAPLRARRMHGAVGRDYVTRATLGSVPYVFYPMHKEPEVTLLVYSRPYRNQIEVVRRVAESVPVGLDVLVKEHPAAVGRRPVSYYRKLLAIPNVRLADPALDSRVLIAASAAVATVAGSIGLEALFQGRPVLTFGLTPYQILPPTMTRRVIDPDSTASTLRALLDEFHVDDGALLAYVAATMAESAGVNLYSGLLGRAEVYRPPSDGTTGADPFDTELQKLVSYTARVLRARQETR
ncbi:MAG: hypothetical protein M3R55_14660 [Acidobacteriota bacterium]|nr:hypothetical protein [Acidobacteriota bacterium]